MTVNLGRWHLIYLHSYVLRYDIHPFPFHVIEVTFPLTSYVYEYDISISFANRNYYLPLIRRAFWGRTRFYPIENIFN